MTLINTYEPENQTRNPDNLSLEPDNHNLKAISTETQVPEDTSSRYEPEKPITSTFQVVGKNLKNQSPQPDNHNLKPLITIRENQNQPDSPRLFVYSNRGFLVWTPVLVPIGS